MNGEITEAILTTLKYRVFYQLRRQRLRSIKMEQLID